MLESFPHSLTGKGLEPRDFITFSESYAEMVVNRLPTAKSVRFFRKTGDLAQLPEEFAEKTGAIELFQQVIAGSISHVTLGGVLLMSFDLQGEEKIVGVIDGADPIFLARLSDDWLLETRGELWREFLLVKQARIDLRTGLLNLANLKLLLQSSRLSQGLHLILVGLPPKRSSYLYGHRHLARSVLLLRNFIADRSALHYLGQSIFAFVLHRNLDEASSKIEGNLVAYLKKEGCHRVHVGSSIIENTYPRNADQAVAIPVLDESWTALRHAEKRGPFSFCQYHHLAFPQRHPLAPPQRGLVRKINGLWAGVENFSLLLFRADTRNSAGTALLTSHLTGSRYLEVAGEVYVVRQGDDVPNCKKWAEDLVENLGRAGAAGSYSVGISRYPQGDSKKSEMLLNCRKALLHAEFFGPSSVVDFDSTSLNISGDIYLNEGDFTRAIKEYRRGIRLGVGDINLYNSLGVTLAMMGRLAQAEQSFLAALDCDQCNFMALYNLGLVKQAKDELQQACHYLEKAYENRHGADAPETVQDLLLQLGILSAEIDNFTSALIYLNSWLEANGSHPRKEKTYYSLGCACHGLGENRKAMSFLQKALGYDEFDDRAMNLLGRIYLEEGEGAEIALALCQKSVDLEPQKLVYKLYLAEVLVACGRFIEARNSLYRCLRNKRCRVEAQLILGTGYQLEGQFGRARGWFDKVLSTKGLPKKILEMAQKGRATCLV